MLNETTQQREASWPRREVDVMTSTCRPALRIVGRAERPRIRVLVVDDLPEICMLFGDLHRRIRDFDIELVTECNSARAVERLREPFDLVISDFRMREVDGVTVLKAARDVNPEGLRVLMTGYNEIPASVDRIRSARVDAYLQKPLMIQDLLILLRAMLRRDETTLLETRAHARHLESLAAASQEGSSKASG